MEAMRSNFFLPFLKENRDMSYIEKSTSWSENTSGFLVAAETNNVFSKSGSA